MRIKSGILGLCLLLIVAFHAVDFQSNHTPAAIPEAPPAPVNREPISTPTGRPDKEAESRVGWRANASSKVIEDYIRSLSPLRHDYYSTEFATWIMLLRPAMDPLDSSKLYLQDPTYVKAILLEHARMTGAYKGIEIEVLDLRNNADRYTIRFRQVIHDGRSTNINSIVFNSAGVVERMTTHILTPESVIWPPSVLLDEALIHAQNALALELGTDQSESVIWSNEQAQRDHWPLGLYYELEDIHKPPSLYWRFSLRPAPSGLPHTVWVNAETGETKVHSNVIIG